MPDLWTVQRTRGNEAQIRLHLHPGQLRVWDSTRRFVWMLAGSQGGKTAFGPIWLWREVQRRGQGDNLAVTASFPLLKLKMLPEFLRFFQHTLHLGEWRAGDKVFEFHDHKTRVIFGSATNAESLESATAKAAWLDECGQDAFRLESWEAIQRRLMLNQGRALGTTTLYNLGWLKQQAFDPWRNGDPDHDIIQFASTLNPAFPKREFERARRTLPRWKFRMFFRGEYDRPAGLIYSDFIDAYREQGGHKVHPFDLPPEWPRWVGVDFGPIHTSLVWIAKDPEKNVFYLYRESLSGRKTTPVHAAEALAVSKGVNVISWYGGAPGELQERWDWGAAGVPLLQPPVGDVEPGLDRVIGLFKTYRLFVFDTCVGLLDELGTYSREVDEAGNPTVKIKDKEQFHRLDALRYVVSGLDRGSVLVAFG